jgi:nucleoside-diphosphate-sugar epimerase
MVKLAEKIWFKINGSDIPFKYISDDPFPYDVQKRIPETLKAKTLLGFEALTSLDVVLDEVIPWIQDAISKGLI